VAIGPTGPTGPGGDDPDLVRICQINWTHPDPLKSAASNVTSLSTLNNDGVRLAFTDFVFNGDIHAQSFMVLAMHRDAESGLNCWCEIPARRLTGTVTPANCDVTTAPTFPGKASDPVNGLLFTPGIPWQGGTTYRVVLKGDFVRSVKNGKAVDANHLPKWLNNRISGDGKEGGTFDSWFITKG